ncbi:hypothetical protein M2277_005633 [Paenibacillus sp. LBL]|uniref:hypothetical protein n=1 Tax=Paenibacillus sp. LBL TaxID=2940563 RepID=UPI00247360B9|nr:hypothetical protein [Paenibacillus sp. LBL]MDH6674934.1 hypothetical protein [Paenibacillus sp. LBL]
MKLISMELTGFRNYKEKHFFSFGVAANQILGDRGKGKTALGEAILWCLRGCDLQGNTTGIQKRLKNRGSKEIRVETQWDIEEPNGSTRRHSFCRVSKGRTTSLFLDGKESNQSDFDVLIGSTEVFLSIFSPGYIGGISAIKLRNVILSLLPAHDHATVINDLDGADQNRLIHFDMTDPLRCLQDLRVELQEWHEHLREVEIHISSIRIGELFNGSPELIQEENRKLNSLKQKLDDLIKTEGPDVPVILQDWEKELSSLGNQYRELVREWKEINKKPLPHATNIQSAAHDRQAELDRISAQCQMVLDHGFALKERIQSERKRFEEDQADFLGQKDYELQQLRNEIHRLEVKKNLRRSNELRAEGLARLHKQFDEGIVERERIQAEIQSVHNFMLEYARKQVETANRELTLAEILLTSKRDAEGSITLRYKLLYDKKEYFSLSSSEKIRCSFELSHLAHKILGRRIPVFIDTGESIEAFMDAKTQFFVTSVVPHATLSCDVVVA